MTKILAVNLYEQLVQDLKREIAEGLARAQEAYDREKTLTYWKMGKTITKHLLNNTRADYGKQLFNNLSRDLGISERLLYQMTQFYNAYLAFSPIQTLKWSHYRLLSSIKDEEKRTQFEERAVKENWSMRKLDDALRKDKEDEIRDNRKSVRKEKLSVFRERLYTYSIFKDAYADNLMIDCGFNVFKESNFSQFEGKFIESVKTETGFEFKKSNASHKHLYAYKAFVKEVIDGDTLWLIIDCGFRVWLKQKVRLRGIDAPPMETENGMQAYNYVKDVLANMSYVVIKCHGRDKFDRYLSDLFYLKGEEDPQVVFKNGNFLNQELLDNNLASTVE